MMNKFISLKMNKDLVYLTFNIEKKKITNTAMYKVRLRRYIDRDEIYEDKILLKEGLTYPDYKKIIEIIRRDSVKRNYKFIVSDELNKYIKNRELYIGKRARAGLEIKNQSDMIFNEFLKYKSIVDNSMIRILRDKQAWDSFFMCTMKRSANFSVPGSGKTSSALGVYSYLEQIGLINKIVMIGPKNSFSSWEDEFINCFGTKKVLKLFNIQDYNSLNDKKNAIMYETGGKNLLLINYESLVSLEYEVKKIIDEKTLLIYDEVHKVKNVDGIRAASALEISKNAQYIITMTGTPIPNSYLDIKNILMILYGDEYKEYFGFSEWQLKSPTEDDIENINTRIQPFFCRTNKRQLGVPDANDDILINVEASTIENEIFNILLLKYAKNKLALIIRLLQLESDPKMLLKSIEENWEEYSAILDTNRKVEDIDYVDYSEQIISLINSIDKTTKFKACINKAKEIYEKGESLIIWCIFIDSIFNIANELKEKGIAVGVIYGGTSDEERNMIINKFRNKELDVLITNPHTLAESISLHSVCHNAIYYEYSYNLVHLLQSKDRIHRLGLAEDQYTQYYFMQKEFSNNNHMLYSLGEQIYDRLVEKERIMLDAIDKDRLEILGTSNEDLDLIFSDLNL